MVGPILTYLLPILIGFTGGRMIYDLRGGVVGATATMGVIVAADIPMFLGAMVMGPLAGYLMKITDNAFKDRIKQGFEMLYNNFSAGILGALLAIAATYAIGPVVEGLNVVLASGVEALITAGSIMILASGNKPAVTKASTPLANTTFSPSTTGPMAYIAAMANTAPNIPAEKLL